MSSRSADPQPPGTQLPEAEDALARLVERMRARGRARRRVRRHLLRRRVDRGAASAAICLATHALGFIDVSYYRDDYNRSGLKPNTRRTELPFDVEGATIVLVDDVLYTGRSVRAAINELFDFGRPARDRACRAGRPRRPRAADRADVHRRAPRGGA